MKGKIVCKEKEIFSNTLIYVKILMQIGPDIKLKSVFQFHLILILIIRCQEMANDTAQGCIYMLEAVFIWENDILQTV